MQKTGTIFNHNEINEILRDCLSEQIQVQCLFNQGKHVYLATIIEVMPKHVLLDFGNIQEDILSKTIDFYSPTVFVFFNKTLRFQFLTPKTTLIDFNGSTCLNIPIPNSIHIVEGRQSSRVDLPENFARLHIQTNSGDFSLPIREMSSGGLSLWNTDSLNLAPHSTLKIAKIEFPSLNTTIECTLEVVRIQYFLANHAAKSHLLSFKFTAISEKNKNFLTKQLTTFTKEKTQN